MYKIETRNDPRLTAFLGELSQHHLSVAAVCAGTAPGAFWVDDQVQPTIGFIETPEGAYLTGAVAQTEQYPALKALIPERAYLTLHSTDWADVLPQIWSNRVARRHERLHLRWQQHLPDWRALLPAGYTLVAIDDAFLQRRDRQHHGQILALIEGWHSPDYFLQHGFGFCVLHGDTIVSRCMADCVVDTRCEIGVSTHADYRGRGLAAAAVAATVDYCLTHGFTHIGWHCLRSNTGSRRLAEKVGFGLVAEYAAYSAVLPAENVGDLTPTEATDWALHYEQFLADDPWYRLFAAEAWALAGDHPRALDHLTHLAESNWSGDATLLAQRWPLQRLRALPAFQQILTTMQNRTTDQSTTSAAKDK